MILNIDKLTDVLPVAGARHWPIVDSTKLQCYAACPRKYFLEYALGWRADSPSNHLVFGQAWHTALEHLYNSGFAPEAMRDAYDRAMKVYRKEFPPSTDEWFGGKTPEAMLVALVEYAEQYASDLYDYKVLATEVYDQVPIFPMDGYEVTVKLDAVLQDTKTGEIVIMEHKTGSSSGKWWANQWHLSLQVGAYIQACNHYYGQDETKCIVDGTFFLKTKRTFQRELVTRSSDSMENWMWSTKALIDDISMEYACLPDAAERGPTLDIFLQNPTACSNYGGCEFFDLCTCSVNPLELWKDGGRKPPLGFKEFWWNPCKEEEVGDE